MSESFAERWLSKERDCGLAHISEGMVRSNIDLVGFDIESRRLLSESGLPRSAAPCLSFGDCVNMPQIWEVFSPGQWQARQRADLDQFRMLGADGAGNPICVDEKTGEVWLLDHEDAFHTRQFVNSSVARMAECLLHYMGQDDADLLRKEIESVDAQALAQDCFWYYEVACLRDDGG